MATTTPIRLKRPRSTSPGSSPNKVKKLKLLETHTLVSPFPNHTRPTATEAYEVHTLLATAHPDIQRTALDPSDENNSAQTCGSVPNVLESLIGTILSQNTTSKNSTAAKRSLDGRFGRNNFEAIAHATQTEVVDAIRMGGLANKKAGVIQRILREVKERHGSYSLQHLAGVVATEGTTTTTAKVKKEEEITEMASGTLGAEMKPATDEDAMKELVSYDGVGPKTASCVLLFCLGRASFPVDTHVFRLSRLLGWVPPRADRITAQAHLDMTIPNELKYGLHVLMVGHGRRCRGCRAKGSGACVLKDWLRSRRGIKEEEMDELERMSRDDVDVKPII